MWDKRLSQEVEVELQKYWMCNLGMCGCMAQFSGLNPLVTFAPYRGDQELANDGTLSGVSGMCGLDIGFLIWSYDDSRSYVLYHCGWLEKKTALSTVVAGGIERAPSVDDKHPGQHPCKKPMKRICHHHCCQLEDKSKTSVQCSCVHSGVCKKIGGNRKLSGWYLVIVSPAPFLEVSCCQDAPTPAPMGAPAWSFC